MLNYETILSNYDDKLTLMQWLKKVEAALENASATAFHVNKRGNATLTFSIDFADGTSIESEPIVLQQGESVASGRITNGHLILTLTNGDNIDAGVILDGNVNALNVTGNLSVGGDLSVTGDIINPNKEININILPIHIDSNLSVNNTYSKALYDTKSLQIVVNFTLTNNTSGNVSSYVVFQLNVTLPANIATKIIDNEGNSVAETEVTNFAGITMGELYVSPNSTYAGSDTSMALCLHNTRYANTLIIRARPHNGGSFTIAAGETKYFTGRLLLSF